jgi:hypothetical protein
MTATLNDQYPGATPAGTVVEVVSEIGASVFIKVGRKTVKVSRRWLDFPESEPKRCPTCGHVIEAAS